jgi:hypothetical protein
MTISSSKLAEVHPRFHTPAAAIVALPMVRGAGVCRQICRINRRRHLHRLDFYGLGAAIFPLRRVAKGAAIPYRVPGHPWTPLLFVLAAAAIVGNAIVVAFLDPKQFINWLSPSRFLLSASPPISGSNAPSPLNSVSKAFTKIGERASSGQVFPDQLPSFSRRGTACCARLKAVPLLRMRPVSTPCVFLSRKIQS